jgi:hypothetical protein
VQLVLRVLVLQVQLEEQDLLDQLALQVRQVLEQREPLVQLVQQERRVTLVLLV